MNLTREGDYAVLCVLDLARNGYASTSQVAHRHDVSHVFLAKIVHSLARAGILTTRRGVKGGIMLARSPESLTLLEVIEAAQGPLHLNLCIECPARCKRLPSCPVYAIWRRAQDQLEETLRVSVQEILDDADVRQLSPHNGRLRQPSRAVRGG